MADDGLSAAQRARIRRAVMGAAPEPGQQDGELNVVPFLDIITNVMMFVLATVAVALTSSVDVRPPSGRIARESRPVALNVVIVPAGFVVSAFGQRLGAGCESSGSGLAVGRSENGDYDFAGLRACAERIRSSASNSDGEREVVITANPEVEFQTIVRAMDALRGSGERPLFPMVAFGVPQ
jgi:biopolymer transport protein ExbD